MSRVKTRRQQGLLIRNVDWRQYTQMLRFFAERPGYRLTYERGRLEIMSPLLVHDNDARLLGRFVYTLTEEFHLPIMAGGSTTFRRRKHRRGLEPDECFWIAHEPQMRGKETVDLRVDPPPDLCIEVDIMSSSIDRMPIYATLGITEVWRLEGRNLSFHVLQGNRQYVVTATSPTFAQITPADLMHFAALRGQTDENAIVQQFRDWLRLHIAASPSGGGTPPLT